ncbi:MAG: phage tail tape measure protein, partial [Gelidibacter sp.]|nr:phage tail tape measure protein [Gelidibacter sp.]
MANAQRSVKQFGTKLTNVGAGLTLGITTPLIGLGALAIKTAADFEVLETSLVTAFNGSKSAAKTALKTITEFAAKTPFQVEQVADAFIKLKNLGLDPSEAALTSYGNTAAAMGKSLNQVIEAVADAATGEFERLKEFGIKSKSEGDKVTFTFKGIATTVKKDSESIQQYLLNIGNTDFAGGMERQSKTFNGQLSTLKDSVQQLSIEFGTILLQYITPLVGKIAKLTESFKNLSPETKKVIVVIGAFAAALGPILLTIGYLATNVIPGLIVAYKALSTTIVSTVIPAFKSFNIVALANPVAIITAAIAGLVYGFTVLVQKITPAVSKLKTFWNLIRSLGDYGKFVQYQINDQAEAMIAEAAAADVASKALADYNAELAKIGTNTPTATKPLEGIRLPESGVSSLISVDGSGIDASNEKLRQQIAILESARSQYAETSAEYKYLSDQIAFHSETIKNSIKGIVGEAATLPTKMAEVSEQTNSVWQVLKDNAQIVGEAVAGAFSNMTNRFVDSLNLADDGFQGFVKGLAKTINQLISQLLASALAQAITSGTQTGTSTGPAAVFTTPAFIATAVGGVLAAFAAIPKFASGGI